MGDSQDGEAPKKGRKSLFNKRRKDAFRFMAFKAGQGEAPPSQQVPTYDSTRDQDLDSPIVSPRVSKDHPDENLFLVV